jgi:peptidoglycan hydrolase-like protein with peptidoglycan-binding domain
MRRIALILLAVAAFGGAPAAPSAADTALIVVNTRYDAAPRLRGLGVLTRLGDDLRRGGFDVRTLENATAADMRSALSRLLAAGDGGRILIVAGGHFLRGGSDSWLLGRDADVPDLATVAGSGVAVSLLAEVAGTAPGRAVLAIAPGRSAAEAGRGLEPGIGRIEAPQGVTVIAGPAEELATLVSGPLLAPGADLPAAIRERPGLRATGFLSSALSFTPASDRSSRPETPAIRGDLPAWREAERIGTVAAYRSYLERFPNGIGASIARSRLDDLAPDGPEAREAALALTRSERRELQRDLTILGHDTRGIDGIFGPATRAAIVDWQAERGVPRTGYLDEEQVAALRREGDIREAVRAEERRQEERADRAWWETTGAGGSPAGLRDYLARYPDGVHAEEARQTLEDFAWRAARDADTAAAYRTFLDAHPRGRHAEAARARLREMGNAGPEPEPGLAEAQAREAALNLPSITRLLVEQRLARLELAPGRVDGTFDADTRAAIREYQEDRGLPVTGYLDQSMLALFLAGSLGEILR